jgi:hypothetical protein
VIQVSDGQRPREVHPSVESISYFVAMDAKAQEKGLIFWVLVRVEGRSPDSCCIFTFKLLFVQKTCIQNRLG